MRFNSSSKQTMSFFKTNWVIQLFPALWLVHVIHMIFMGKLTLKTHGNIVRTCSPSRT